MRVEIGRVGDVVSRTLEPPNEIYFPRDEIADSAVSHRTIERYLHGRGRPFDRVGAVAVERVEALSGHAIIRIVVVCLIGRNTRLVEERRGTAVLDDEDHPVLVSLGVGQLRAVHATGPITWN